jgi:uncharacterized protein
VKVLSISDVIIPYIYSSQVRSKYGHVDLVIACGDLPYYYQEFVISMLDKPLFFVRGNHDPVLEYSEGGNRSYPHGGIDLHRRHVRYKGLLMVGIEGSERYKRRGSFQYTQSEMWRHVFSLVPGFFYNYLIYGRFVDVLVTHASPWEIHDKSDRAHRGIKAFRWLLRVFKPRYHYHGHIHVYRSDTVTETEYLYTRVINTYGAKETELNVG